MHTDGFVEIHSARSSQCIMGSLVSEYAEFGFFWMTVFLLVNSGSDQAIEPSVKTPSVYLKCSL